MRWIAWVLDRLDLLLSWWGRLSQSDYTKTEVTTVTFLLLNIWAWLSEQTLFVHIIGSLGGAAFLVILFTYLPRLLWKFRSPPFAITIRFNQLSLFSTVVPICITNRSAHHHMVLSLTLCIPLLSGQEFPIEYENTLVLGPQEHIARKFSFIPKAPLFDPIFFFHKAYLLVYDNISGRSVKVQIPGTFPTQ